MKAIKVLEKIVEMQIIFFNKYKMIDVTKETWEKSGVEVIMFNGIKLLNENHIEEELNHAKLRKM